MATSSNSEPCPGYGGLLGTNMVKIEIGPEKIEFAVHKDILCKKSDYFFKMFNNGFEETITQRAHLPDIHPFIFSLFLEWVYGDSIQSLKVGDNKEGLLASICDLSKLYSFGEFLIMPDFQDCVANAILKTLRARTRTGRVLYAFEAVHIYENVDYPALRNLAVEYLYHMVTVDGSWDNPQAMADAMQIPELAFDFFGESSPYF